MGVRTNGRKFSFSVTDEMGTVPSLLLLLLLLLLEAHILSVLFEFPCSNQASSMLANEQSSLIAGAK
jgi:hypothetical protein